MALRRSRSTWPTWLGFCGTFTVRWWAIVHESLASPASSDFWRKTRGLERQQCNRWGQIPMFFLSVWAMCLMLMEHRSWHLMTVGVWSISCHSSMYTNVGLWPSSEVWIWYGLHKDLCILFGFKLCFGYCILEIFEPLTFSVAAAIILLNNALAVSSIPHDSLFSTANSQQMPWTCLDQDTRSPWCQPKSCYKQRKSGSQVGCFNFDLFWLPLCILLSSKSHWSTSKKHEFMQVVWC